jgi:hypothetical protein
MVVAGNDQVNADLDEEVVLLNLKSGEYYGLNAVGATIWSLIQVPSSVEALRKRLLQEYPGVEPDRCARETLALLEDLAEAGLVRVLDAGENI